MKNKFILRVVARDQLSLRSFSGSALHMSKNVTMKQVEQNCVTLLQEKGGSIGIHAFNSVYRDLFGAGINYKELGKSKMKKLLEDIPSLELTGPPANTMVTLKSNHLANGNIQEEISLLKNEERGSLPLDVIQKKLEPKQFGSSTLRRLLETFKNVKVEPLGQSRFQATLVKDDTSGGHGHTFAGLACDPNEERVQETLPQDFSPPSTPFTLIESTSHLEKVILSDPALCTEGAVGGDTITAENGSALVALMNTWWGYGECDVITAPERSLGSSPLNRMVAIDCQGQPNAWWGYGECDVITAPERSPGTKLNHMIAIDCEGVPDNLYLIQLATPTATYILDCVKMEPQQVCRLLLEPLFASPNHIKLMHDLRCDVLALASIGGMDVTCFQQMLDTQLVMEYKTFKVFTGFNNMLEYFGQSPHPLKNILKGKKDAGQEIFGSRPLSSQALEYAAADVALLIQARDRILEECGDDYDKLIRASDRRAATAVEQGGTQSLCFDVSKDYEFASSELISEVRPQDALQPVRLEVHHDLDDLLELLPTTMVETLKPYVSRLSDIALDVGQEPIAWADGKRLRLEDDGQVVTIEDLDRITAGLGSFGVDNRAGIERQLHRISAIRNRNKQIIGLTLRAGRHITGNTYMITDLLHKHKESSILILGEPGSGKTTIVREICRVLSEQSNVFIVDTSNEIAGDGDIMHPCVGQARRMMVSSPDMQSSVMIECIQNHTPEVMVIDEIGRPKEVEAAQTCKNRGVRLIASAHGDMRKLVRNPKLRGLVGGVESVTLGDNLATIEAMKRGHETIQKTKSERAGPPIFEIICQVKRASHNEWTIVMNSGEAVDRILAGEEYSVQKRKRNPETGALHMSLSYE